MQVSTDAAIAAYVDRIDFLEGACFGAVDDEGRLIALVEGLSYRIGSLRCIEAALSTDVEHRRRGLARSGFEHLKAWCLAADVDRVVLHCTARNTAMRRLLQTVDAVTQLDGGEIDATVRLSASAALGDER